MPLLHVAFQEGFSADEVVVAVNGKQVFRRAGITTKTQIGYADSFDLEVPSGELRLDAQVATRKLATSKAIRVVDRLYVGISLDRAGESLTFEIADEPFGYL